MPRVLVALGLAVCVIACESKRANEQKVSPAAAQKASPAPLVDLPTPSSLEAVRTAFNAHRGEPRFIALLSPT